MKGRKSTQTTNTTQDSEEKFANGEAVDQEVSTYDVNVGIPDVQSIITQVDRNAPPPKPVGKVERPTAVEKKQKTPFFRRLFCCYGGNGRNTGQVNFIHSSSSSDKLDPRNLSKPIKLQEFTAQQVPLTSSPPNGNRRKKLLALDLDETLVHSSFQPVDQASFIINVTIEGTVHKVYVIKRPGVDEFLERMAKCYELVIYTASLSKYADPLLDLLDYDRLCSKRLFRENCVFYDGHYVKDLSLLDRDITQTIIVDNSPMSYIFHPENAIDCVSFFDDPNDIEMWQIADFLENIEACDDVRTYCRHWREWVKHHPTSAPPFDSNGNIKWTDHHTY